MYIGHLGVIEEVANREQSGEDVLESAIGTKLFDSFLQIKQRIAYFLDDNEHKLKVTTSIYINSTLVHIP